MLARLKTQGGSGSALIDEDDLTLGVAGRGEDGRESLDSAAGTTRGASAALRSQLVDIKVRGLLWLC